METICKEQVTAPEKIHSPEAYFQDIDAIGCQITAVFRRHEWISQEDIAGLLVAKDAIIRIKGRVMRRA